MLPLQHLSTQKAVAFTATGAVCPEIERMALRKFQISSRLFWGFRTSVNMDTVETEGDVLRAIKASLIAFLQEANLLALVEEAQKTTMHLHNTIPDLIARKDELFFACDHEH